MSVTIEEDWLVVAEADDSVNVEVGTPLLPSTLVDWAFPGVDRETGVAVSVVLNETTVVVEEL